MKPTNQYLEDMLDIDLPAAKNDIVWRACAPVAAYEDNGHIILDVVLKTYQRVVMDKMPVPLETKRSVLISALGGDIIRITTRFGEGTPDDTSDIIDLDDSLGNVKLRLVNTENGWDIIDKNDMLRAIIDTRDPDSFCLVVYPDGKTIVSFNPYDCFGPGIVNSLPLGFVQRGLSVVKTFFSLKASFDEKFAGTGERFRDIDLSGQTILLENDEATGVNSRRSYKNVPFYISSAKYGLFINTSAHSRFSFRDISTRSSQGMAEDEVLDLFLIGGGSFERILVNYRKITGFPPEVPLWTYGIWMSRLTYMNAKEVTETAKKLRNEGFPCDVIHIDTGWFDKPWKCDWKFSKDRYPDPEGMIDELGEMGFRLSLWQLPFVSKETDIYDDAFEKGFIVASTDKETYGLFDLDNNLIDFTNPAAVDWYKGMLKRLFDMGVAVIKVDFGETIKKKAEYHGMSADMLHNLYALLYQKAAYDIKKESTGEGVIWARAGWAGCQRYPVHWGGDSICDWDGLAGSIKGGLHLGMSGYAFWSHDIPGFYSAPEFNKKPDDILYIRWTQTGVFTSHMRYHGTSEREPYNYPKAADTVRKWFKLRYAIIPYLLSEGRKASKSGYPLLRAMILENEDDKTCWDICDQFYCGENLLIAPVMNREGVRDVYLPEGEWVDFWSGEDLRGPILLKNIESDMEHIPVYAKKGSEIDVYAGPVNSTNDFDLDSIKTLKFDNTYRGIKRSILSGLVDL